MIASTALVASTARAAALSNGTFQVQTGTNGEITSLQLTGDAFPTNYVLNATNAPGQNTADHAWLGELMFTGRLGTGAWTTALTSQSSDVRITTQTATSVTETYQGSANAQGIKNFKLAETYSLVDDYLYWQIALTNTTTQTLELGDVGLPLSFNEYWNGGDVVYETRALYHSFTGNGSSYVTIGRPSGIGPFLLMTPDASTGAGFEYMDNWRPEEHPGSAWAAGGGTPAWTSGLDVFYIHSNVIKKTNRGYLPNTSLILAPGQSQTYAFKFFKVTDRADVEARLYGEGLIDVHVVPGMIFATNMTAEVDLHTSKTINSITAQFPSTTSITPLPSPASAGADHHIYRITLSQLGQNDVTVSYGNGETTTLQFYAIEPIDAAMQRHATFLTTSMLWTSGPLDHVFDDWQMTTSTKKGATGGGGWGDDWGWTKGEFLAEKNAQTPVASEVSALDAYLTALWGTEIDGTAFTVDDWWCPSVTTPNCGYDRAYAYPHAYNTFFSMYEIASRYPGLVAYKLTADQYLLRAYDILKSLFTHFPPSADAGTKGNVGFMGEQTTPEIIAALKAGGHAAEAEDVTAIMAERYGIFSALPYPYASEYTYDNTGEEAVYTIARMNGDTTIPARIDAKTRACRGQEPVWYYYADPVTNNGENWWQFQYTASLAGYCMDDWLKAFSTTPEVDERLSYAAKVANVTAINSGQMSAAAANLGAVAWTYQAMKGNVYVGSPYISGGEDGTLMNGWRSFSGEADLGLFGALRVLSSDVAVDPVFGLVGYGCDVVESGSCYAITPKDGVFERVNLISQKLSLAIDRDRYDGVTASASNDYVGFTLKNQTPSAAHTTTLTLSGLVAGTYPVSIDGAAAGTVTVAAGQPSTVPLAIGTGATTTVQIGSGCGGSTTGSDDGGGESTGADGAVIGGNTGPGSTGGDASGGSGGGSGSSGGGGNANGGNGGSVTDAGGLDATGGRGAGGPSGDAGSGTDGPSNGSGCGCVTQGVEKVDGLETALLVGIPLLGAGRLRARRRRKSARLERSVARAMHRRSGEEVIRCAE